MNDNTAQGIIEQLRVRIRKQPPDIVSRFYGVRRILNTADIRAICGPKLRQSSNLSPAPFYDCAICASCLRDALGDLPYCPVCGDPAPMYDDSREFRCSKADIDNVIVGQGSQPDNQMGGNLLLVREGHQPYPENGVQLTASILGGISKDANALMYFVVRGGAILNGGPLVLTPNSRINTANLPNAMRLNSNAQGQWKADGQSTADQPAAFVNVQPTATGTLDPATGLTVFDTKPGSSTFLQGDTIIFVLVNYAGKPYNDDTLMDSRNWRVSYTGKPPDALNLPENKDVIAQLPPTMQNAPTNAHFSASTSPVNPFDGLFPRVAVIGGEDRSFRRSDLDFQDIMLLLTSNPA